MVQSSQTPSAISFQIDRHARGVNLRYLYPISQRLVLKRCALWIVALFLLSTGLSTLRLFAHANIRQSEVLSDLDQYFLGALVLMCTLTIAKVVIEELRVLFFRYTIEDRHLIVEKGIFLKSRGCFPLSRITDIYLDRNIWDFLFGLTDLHVSTPTHDSGVFAHIQGLSRRTAIALQQHLILLLESGTPEALHEAAKSDAQKVLATPKRPYFANDSHAEANS